MNDSLLRYLILDDDELARLAIETEARKYSFLEKIASCAHPLEAAEIINTSHPDIVFLDIEMPDVSGLEMIRMKYLHNALPVLITSHPEFAVESYDLDAFDYLIKPISAERFARCAQRLQSFCEMRTKAWAFENEQEADCIVVKQGHDKYKLPINEILYLEAMKDYTKIKTNSGQYLVLTTLIGILDKLPRDIFVRVHRSYVVNCEKVDAVKKNTIHVQAQTLPVGKSYRDSVKSLFG
ncbi:MAG: response regulator transcription factor [Bacteroidetes bacterium]|nr:response regulator transcription factor [Bacteroidota bacterium]